jgi:heme/copper-type cytochrome/quinol oxidase subunit 4
MMLGKLSIVICLSFMIGPVLTVVTTSIPTYVAMEKLTLDQYTWPAVLALLLDLVACLLVTVALRMS